MGAHDPAGAALHTIGTAIGGFDDLISSHIDRVDVVADTTAHDVTTDPTFQAIGATAAVQNVVAGTAAQKVIA